jgi:alkylation response protein AidB-like acyl-CoA dehydrogenase
MSVHVGLCGLSLLQWGTEAQQAEFLIPLARGEKIGCGAFSESGAGSDVANLQTTAKQDGSDYILNGEKMWISLASKADFALLTARTDPNPKRRSQGLSSFIVDLHSKGVTTGDIKGKLGVRAGSTGWISMQDVRVPTASRLGEHGEGFKITMSAFDSGRYTVAAGAAGLIRACLEASVAYAKDRKTFGQPIAEHQLVQAKIARMASDYEIAKLLYMKVGWLKNQGVRNTVETSRAKQFATDASFHAASEAIAVHGSYGYSDEFPVERYLRNARGAMIYEGTNEIHSLIQAGYALGNRTDKALRREMPAYEPQRWQAELGSPPIVSR